MAEPEETYGKYEMRRIVKAAEAFMQDPRTDSNIRDQVFRWLRTLFSASMHADDQSDTVLSEFTLSVAETAFNLGVICGTPAMVTHLKAGKHAAGGISSGNARRKSAKVWKDHATELADAIRKDRPHLSQEALAHEILESWKDEGFKPGFSSIEKHLRSLKRT